MTRSFSLLLFSACVLFFCCSGQKSCRGRCGEVYSRGKECHCDYECLSHNECCRNYESACTTKDSCKGRCGELFKRGRKCHCDANCFKFSQCCPDYETQCNIEDTALKPANTAASVQRSNSSCQIPQINKPTDYSMEEETSEPEVTSPLDDIENEGLNGISEPDMDPEQSQGSAESELSIKSMANTLPPTATPVSDMHAEAAPSITSEPRFPPQKDFPESTTINPINESAQESTMSMATTRPTPTVVVEPTNQNPEANHQTPLEIKPTTLTDPYDNYTEIKTPSSSAESTQAVFDQTKPNPTPSSDANPHSNSETNGTTPANNPEVTGFNSLTDPKFSNPVQSEDAQDPEDNPETHTKPSENQTSEVVNILNTVATDSPSPSQQTEVQNGDIKDIPTTTDFLSNSATIKSTPAFEKVPPSPTKAPENPTTKPKETYSGFDDSSLNYQADANYDTNLCSGNPINGLTTLGNGTIVVFRGHYFWPLDSRRNPRSAQSIKDVWGIPSPIDTVFTRCNCQGKTYFFKGNNYWRFENDNMDPDFPKPIREGFGLKDDVTAALSMPKYRSRRESVVFFKRGGLVQKYTYRVTPTCSSRSSAHTIKKARRAADPELGLEINIQSWRGFPSNVASAVSVPSQGGDGYKYYVFSQKKYYSVKMEGEKPVILTPREGPEKQKPAKSWFRCPEINNV